MSVYDYIEPYPEPKPPDFPFHVDVRPDKQWELETTFKNVFKSKVDHLNPLNPNADALVDPALKQKQRLADIKAAQQMAGIASGLKFLPRAQKVAMERTDSRDNFERIKDADFQSSKDLLKNLPVDDPTAPSPLQGVDPSTYEGAGNTFYHNTNLYQKLTNRNPFNPEDPNYLAFEKDPNYSPINSTFLSGLNKLDKSGNSTWQHMNQIVNKVADRNSRFTLKNLPDPYFANSINHYDMNMDYDNLTQAKSIQRKLSDEEVYFSTMNAYEDSMRFDDAFGSIYGDQGASVGPFLTSRAQSSSSSAVSKAAANAMASESDALTQTEPAPTDSPSASSTDTSNPEQPDAVSNGATSQTPYSLALTDDEKSKISTNAVDSVNSWWNNTGSNLKNNAKLLDDGLLAESTGSITKGMDWGSLPPEVRDNWMNRFFDYYDGAYLPKYKEYPKIVLTDILVDNIDNAKANWAKLIQKGYINPDGELSPAYIKNPVAVKLGGTPEEDDRLQTILRKAAKGRYDLESVDQTLVNNRTRQDQKIIDPYDGQPKSITEITNLLSDGKTPTEKLENTKHAYHLLLNTYANMTGANTKEGSNGKVIGKANQDGTFDVTVAPDGRWQEWKSSLADHIDSVGQKINIGKWEDHKGPLVIKFASRADAQSYANRLAEITQSVAPVLGMFSRDDLFVLKTNAISSDNEGIQTQGKQQYREHISRLIDYNDPVYSNATTQLRNLVNGAIGKRMFEKNLVNKMIINRWGKQKDDYDEKKDEWEDDQIQDLVRESEEAEDDGKTKSEKNRQIEEENKVTEQRNNEQSLEDQQIQTKNRVTEEENQKKSDEESDE